VPSSHSCMGFIIIVRTPVLFSDKVLHAPVDFTLSWTTLVVSPFIFSLHIHLQYRLHKRVVDSFASKDTLLIISTKGAGFSG